MHVHPTWDIYNIFSFYIPPPPLVIELPPIPGRLLNNISYGPPLHLCNRPGSLSNILGVIIISTNRGKYGASDSKRSSPSLISFSTRVCS